MAELAQVLEKTFSQDPKDQQYALNLLQQAAESNFPEYVSQLSTVLSNTAHSTFIRKAAGIQLKNTLTAREQSSIDKNKERWLNLPAEVRDHVKKCILQTLGTEASPSTAAQCVAAIACIESPAKLWPELIERLSTNVVNDTSDPMLKESSLEALAYICQNVRDLPNTAPILTAIVHGMREEETSNYIRLAATTALLNILGFANAKQHFENENERNMLMQVICNATQSAETDIKVEALKCLVKIMSLYYRCMEPYMGRALFHITLQAMKDPVDEVALQGIEFWSNVCDEELRLAAMAEAVHNGDTPAQVSRHYAFGAYPHILPIFTQKLRKNIFHNGTEADTILKAFQYLIEKMKFLHSKKTCSDIDHKFAGIERKIAGIEHKIAGIEDKIAGIERKINEIFQAMISFGAKIPSLTDAAKQWKDYL